MDTKLFLERSWTMMKQHFIMLLVLTLVVAVLSTVTLGILGPVAFAGYTLALIRVVREDREPRIQDLFSQMRLFLPLFVFFLGVMVVVVLGLLLFFLPGVILAVAISFFCMYMVPLMVDLKLGLVDAVKRSTAMISGCWQDHIIAALIYLGLCWVGSLVAIGWLVTLPFGTLFLLQVYDYYAGPAVETPV